MWSYFLENSIHPHKIETYDVWWEYLLHPIAGFIMFWAISGLFIYLIYRDYIEMEEIDRTILLSIGAIAYSGIVWLALPYVLMALIFIWPVILIVIIILIYKNSNIKSINNKPSEIEDYKKSLTN